MLSTGYVSNPEHVSGARREITLSNGRTVTYDAGTGMRITQNPLTGSAAPACEYQLVPGHDIEGGYLASHKIFTT